MPDLLHTKKHTAMCNQNQFNCPAASQEKPLKLVGRIWIIFSLYYLYSPEFVLMYLKCKDLRALRALNHKQWNSGTNSMACGYFKGLLEPCIQMQRYFCCSLSSCRSTVFSRLMLENGQKKKKIKFPLIRI